MRWINKRKEPNYLQEHRGIKGTDYESFKADIGLGGILPASGLRKYLLENQGYICAYCMKRIPHSHTEKNVTTDQMKIEHFVAQTSAKSKAQKLDITYSNLFACCMGNHGKDEKFQTCDTHKKDIDITINPINQAHIRTIIYGVDGSIHSTNLGFENDIDKILNLNEINLKEQREGFLRPIKDRVKEKFSHEMTRKEKNEYLDLQIIYYNSRHHAKYEPFCMIAIYFLESRKK